MATRSSAITSQVVSDGEYAGRSLGYIWNPSTLAYEVATAGAISGVAAVSIADGANVTQGAKGDAAWDGASASPTSQSIFKYIGQKLEAIRALLAGALDVSDRVGRLLGVISGTVTANAGTNLNTSALALDATLTGGTQKAIARGGQKGTTNTNADITHTASGANHEALDVILYDATGNVINPTAIRALTNADVVKAQLQDNAGTAVTVGQKVMASSLPMVIASDQSAVPVVQPALTKGTQGATGVSTQDLKDAGRVQFSAATVVAGVAGVAVEAVLSMVAVRDGVAVAGATTFAVTAGKKLRITHCIVGFISTAAAVVSVRALLRINPTGAAIVTSPIIFPIPLPSAPAVIQQGNIWSVELPESFEFSGTHQFALSHIGSVATYTLWAALIGYEY